MDEIKKLIDGFNRFRAHHYEQDGASFKRLVRQGQSPKIMVIACCDSRVDPAIITDCDPGDLFVVRNVANLMPPCETSGHYHGTSAALEFAVRFLEVRHVIVLGHSGCGGIRSLIQGVSGKDDLGQFIKPWMEIAAEARVKVLNAAKNKTINIERACEQAAIQVSLTNLLSFPWVRERVEQHKLYLHGWYFDLENGELRCHNSASNNFDSLAETSFNHVV